MSRLDELRLLAKVARMYYEDGLTQRAIASRLDLSQPSVSRLLKRAEAEEIVRVIITPPSNTHSDLESALQNAYGLKEAIVVDSNADEEQLLREIGSAAAFYVTNTLRDAEVIGISSWSETLLSMVNAMQPLSRSTGAEVVQILGGVGNPGAEIHAAHLTRRLAQLVGGKAHFLPAPGVAGSEQARNAFVDDPYVQEAMKLFNRITLALVGIGSLEPSKLLASSGNVFSSAELRSLEKKRAVGDVCLRFFDNNGRPVETPVTRRVISIRLDQLQKARRTVGIAGGLRKLQAIRAALLGRWITVLITDKLVAERLLADVEEFASDGRASQRPAERVASETRSSPRA
jgi:DNA-binding transcriptional regulator LsrR (DeoR family)